jgi:glycerol uptake facilitator-like aquaporin
MCKRRDSPWRRVPGYIIAQLVGATLACPLLKALFGNTGMLGATEPGPGISDWQALIMEFVLTAGLVSTILGTASRARNSPMGAQRPNLPSKNALYGSDTSWYSAILSVFIFCKSDHI